MDWRKGTLFLGMILLTPFFIRPIVHGAEKGVTIKMATLAPEGSSWTRAFNVLNTEVMKKTENRVRFKIYPGGVLGDELDMLRKLKIGQIQGAALTSAGLSTLFGDIDVLQIPFFFQKYEEVDFILKKMDSSFRKGFEDDGYTLLGWSEAGFVYLMSTVPIASVADFRRAKVWIWEESPMSKAILDEIGVKAIPLTVPDVLVGLQTGLVEVVYAPPSYAISLQWFTRIRYMNDAPLLYLAGGVLVKKEVFRQISRQDQSLILNSFQDHLERSKITTRNENQEAMKVMTKQGVKLVTSSKDQIDEFKRLSNKAISRISSESFSQRVFDEVRSLLEGYRKGEK
ncbi:MAG: TRAP transporter substrate-binding protein DctP [Thermodesulfobacteriota bacterium]